MPRGRKSRAEKRELIAQIQNLVPFARKGTLNCAPTRKISDPTRETGVFLYLKGCSRSELLKILEEVENEQLRLDE
jgi:hypothetical protein